MKMAFEGGAAAIFTSRDRKRGGEKQSKSNLLYFDFSDEMNEEGEIEDGEIVDSQDEEFGGVGRGEVPIANLMINEVPGSNGPLRFQGAAARSGQNFDNIPSIPTALKKKKKKRKKKRPLALLMEMGMADGDVSGLDTMKATEPTLPPAKKQRKVYVDHDKVNDTEPTSWWKGGHPPVPPPPSNSNQYDVPVTTQQDDFDSMPFGRSPPPVRHRSRSPPGLYDSPYESDENETVPSYGGGGRFDDNRSRGGYGGGGGDGGNQRQHMRGKRNHNSRGRNKKRGKGGRGGGGGGGGGGGSGPRGKQQRRDKSQPICKFFMEGKCHKGSDCIYKHDGEPPKRMDICKFYLNSFCSKGDSCIYMHREYPCKFFHTGAHCFSAENCKFSHDPLTDDTRLLLEKCLDKGDGEGDGMMMDDPSGSGQHFRPGLLGSPPHMYGQQDHQQSNNNNNNNNHESLKGIPSLFDIRVDAPVVDNNNSSSGGQSQQQLSPSQEHQQRHQQQQQQHNIQQGPNGLGFYAETMNNGGGTNSGSGSGGSGGGSSGSGGPRAPLLPLPYGISPSVGGGVTQQRFGYDQMSRSQQQQSMGMMSGGGGANAFPMGDFDDRCREHLDNSSNDERVGYFGGNVHDTDMRLRQMRPASQSGGGSGEEQANWRTSGTMAADNLDNSRGNYYDSGDGGEDFDEWDARSKSTALHNQSFSSDSESETSVKKEATTTTTTPPTATASASSASESNSDNIQIPIHLPKKQRELFLRIQQQQREAEKNIQAKAKKKNKSLESADAATKDDSDDRGVGVGGGGEKESRKDEEGGDNEDDQDDDDDDDVGENEEAKNEKLATLKPEVEDRCDDDDDDADDEKEKWYSSDDDDDDEDQPLTAVLKKLQQQPIPKPDEQNQHQQQQQQQQKPLTSVFNIAKMIQSISCQSSKSVGSLLTTDSSPSLPVPISTSSDAIRDPRAQRHQILNSRDPRAARNPIVSAVVDAIRDPRSKQAKETSTVSTTRPSMDPLKCQTSPPPPAAAAAAAAAAVVVVVPAVAEAAVLQPSTVAVRRERKLSVDAVVVRSPECLMPYKLIPVSASHIDYAYMLNSSELDPTLLLKDPRLTRQLANKINSETSSDSKKKSNNIAKGDLKGHVKGGGGGCSESVIVAPSSSMKPGLHRLGVVTMPGPSGSSSSSGSSSYGRNIHRDHKASVGSSTRQIGSLDDVDELWSVDEDNDMPTVSASSSLLPLSRGSSSPAHIKDYRIGKRTTSRLTDGQPAKIRGGSYQRRTSMDYASPLGFDDDIKGHSSGYDGTAKVIPPSSSHLHHHHHHLRSSTNKSFAAPPPPSSSLSSNYPRHNRNSLELSRPPPPSLDNASSSSCSPSSSGVSEANKPLKEIFKTIDPTASPFC